MESKVLLPYAPILVESTRSIGYSFEAAVADIVDNSISKDAKNIHINFRSINKPYMAIIDDGCGMNLEELETAMRYGSKSSLDDREKDDLGRFGLGLKTASLSQCRKLTVISKCDGVIHAAKWDLDYIIESEDWSVLMFDESELDDIPHINVLREQESGTIVLWEEFDRVSNGTSDFQRVFDEKLNITQDHIALVFHRFTGEEMGRKKVRMFFNGQRVRSIDPFLSSNPATQPLDEKMVRIENEKIMVKPYILPYISKMSAQDKVQLGDKDNLRQSQGFYIYRNKRLIIWGTWFRLIKQYELNKLARVRVDIPNTLDSIWEIDIKKSSATLPDVIKKNLANIVESTVGKSERVYKYRGRKINTGEIQHTWDIVENRGAFKYQVNRELPLIKALEGLLNDNEHQYLESLLNQIEDTFPYGDVYYKQSKKENMFTGNTLEEDEIYKLALNNMDALKKIGGDVNAFIENMKQNDAFMHYPDIIQKLQKEFRNE